MKTGTVRWFDSARGYGVIAPHGEGADLFVDRADVAAHELRSLRDDDQVQYEDGDGPRGLCAVNVRVMPPALVCDGAENVFFTPG